MGGFRQKMPSAAGSDFLEWPESLCPLRTPSMRNSTNQANETTRGVSLAVECGPQRCPVNDPLSDKVERLRRPVCQSGLFPMRFAHMASCEEDCYAARD